tara:strand:- start:731 stop:1441 length:711 start_codon:yes stop_codon:yes gene_type:complete
MKYSKILIFLLFLFCMVSYAYHHQFLNLQNAEQLYARQLASSINHSFLGEPLKSNGLLGQDTGANVGYGFKLGLGANQVLSYFSSSSYSQSSLMYKISKNIKNDFWMGSSIYFDTLTLSNNKSNTISYTIFGGYVSETLDVLINTTYKDYFSSFQFGFGLAWQAISKTKLFIEYLTPIESYASKGVLTSGVKVMTFGHNFYLFLSNQNDIGFIPGTSGANSDQFYTGFKIERIFDF